MYILDNLIYVLRNRQSQSSLIDTEYCLPWEMGGLVLTGRRQRNLLSNGNVLDLDLEGSCLNVDI